MRCVACATADVATSPPETPLKSLTRRRLGGSYQYVFNKLVVQNVGVLKAFTTPNSPKLSKLTLFYARNGRGKSTLTSVMRAARDGCVSTVLGRRSLGNEKADPAVTLVGDVQTIRFAQDRWTSTAPIEVFDTSFIADNIYAGEIIDLAHDRGLFSIIIGETGVRLARHLERFNALAKKAGAGLKDAQAALIADIPSDMTPAEFFAVTPEVNHGKLLERAERALRSVKQADRIAGLKSPILLPDFTLSAGLRAVLASTLADVDVAARDQLLAHFKRFQFDRSGEGWINYGVDHIHDDACPFCGRDGVDEGGMVTLYGQIFSKAYKAHLSTITDEASALDATFGERSRLELEKVIKGNAEAVVKWSEFVSLSTALPEMDSLIPFLSKAHIEVKALLDRKRASPLDAVDAENDLRVVDASLDRANAVLRAYNEAVAAINMETGKAVASAPITEAAATLARDNARKLIQRHSPGVQSRVDKFRAAQRRDKRAKRIRGQIQDRLKDANKIAAEHYYVRVNHYLSRFGASFSITKINSSMPGNVGQADYGLMIKGETIARGRGRLADAVPSFRNTLSAGDKATLAFAFFLSKLDHDPSLSSKTVVIDDPLSSHDTHRRGKTIEAIKNLCGLSAQVLVLSHDEFLLREVSQACAGVPCSAYQIDFENGEQCSSAKVVNLDHLCRAGHTKMVDDLAAYVEHRTGDPDDVVLKVRKVLETHYRRSYAAYFPDNPTLGQIVRAIEASGSTHPCHRDVARLDSCNRSTRDDHHGDNAVIAPKRGVDPDELRVIAIDALQLIGARLPASPVSTGSRPTPAITNL